MRTIAILPVKSFAAAKQRLADGVEAGTRALLAEAMFTDVLGSLLRVGGLDSLLVVSADPVASALARDAGVPVLHDSEQAGQSSAALLGIRHAWPADSAPCSCPVTHRCSTRWRWPALDSSSAVTIVPDRHGTGTNALLLAAGRDRAELQARQLRASRGCSRARRRAATWSRESRA